MSGPRKRRISKRRARIHALSIAWQVVDSAKSMDLTGDVTDHDFSADDEALICDELEAIAQRLYNRMADLRESDR